jgi:hypothetical protein
MCKSVAAICLYNIKAYKSRERNTYGVELHTTVLQDCCQHMNKNINETIGRKNWGKDYEHICCMTQPVLLP